MQKNIALPLILLLLLGACNKQKEHQPLENYNIGITINNLPRKMNGLEMNIVLYEYDSIQMVSTVKELEPATYVQNQQAKFTLMEKDLPQMAYIHYDWEYAPLLEKTPLSYYILEEGNIQIDIASPAAKVSGTPMNDELQTVRDSLDAIYALVPYYTPAQYIEKSKAERAQIDQKTEQIKHLRYQLVRNSLIKNGDNILGKVMMEDLFFYGTSEEIEELYDLLSPNIQATPGLTERKNNTTIWKDFVVGQPCPQLTLEDFNSKTVEQNDIFKKSKYTILCFIYPHFTQSYHEQILEELDKKYKKHEAKGLQVASIICQKYLIANQKTEKTNHPWLQLINGGYSENRYNKDDNLYAFVAVDGRGIVQHITRSNPFQLLDLIEKEFE